MLLLALPALTFAQLGFPVVDVSCGILPCWITKLKDDLTELQTLGDTLKLHQTQALPLIGKSLFETQLPVWSETYSANESGTIGEWLAVTNHGGNPQDVLRRVVETLGMYGPAINALPPESRARAMQRYGQIELAGAAANRALHAMGVYRAQAAQRAAAILQLQQRILSGNDRDNTQIAVLNAIAAAQHLALKNSEATNDLLIASLEQATVRSALVQQTAAERINVDIEFHKNASAELARHMTGTTQALRNIQFPQY
jgi:hypothetical protein